MSVHTQHLDASLSEVHSPRPATARVLIERDLAGNLYITGTLGDVENTVQMLDEAMEALDGQRVPPK